LLPALLGRKKAKAKLPFGLKHASAAADVY
jgi:hypothetical protein